MGVTKKSWVDHSQFQIVWQQIVRLGLENLLTEILAWKEVYFSDPHFFLVIGDIGARIFVILLILRESMAPSQTTTY